MPRLTDEQDERRCKSSMAIMLEEYGLKFYDCLNQCDFGTLTGLDYSTSLNKQEI